MQPSITPSSHEGVLSRKAALTRTLNARLNAICNYTASAFYSDCVLIETSKYVELCSRYYEWQRDHRHDWSAKPRWHGVGDKCKKRLIAGS